jgi:hypothetical protein
MKGLVQADGSGGSADLPAMLQAAYEYVKANKPSRTEVWICSDVRRHDWSPDSGRWQEVRDAFLDLPQPVRFHLLAYPEVAPDDRAVRVTDVRRTETADGAALLLSLRVDQAKAVEKKATVPVQLEVDGARSEINVELTGADGEIENHLVPLDARQTQGWGRVSIPADANPADNEFYFVYERPAARKTVVVAEDAGAARPLELAAGVAPDPAAPSAVEAIDPSQVATADWGDVSLVLWQADLPKEEAAKQVTALLARGGQVVFFPPGSPSET